MTTSGETEIERPMGRNDGKVKEEVVTNLPGTAMTIIKEMMKVKKLLSETGGRKWQFADKREIGIGAAITKRSLSGSMSLTTRSKRIHRRISNGGRKR